jgi:hypothetical protein
MLYSLASKHLTLPTRMGRPFTQLRSGRRYDVLARLERLGKRDSGSLGPGCMKSTRQTISSVFTVHWHALIPSCLTQVPTKFAVLATSISGKAVGALVPALLLLDRAYQLVLTRQDVFGKPGWNLALRLQLFSMTAVSICIAPLSTFLKNIVGGCKVDFEVKPN